METSTVAFIDENADRNNAYEADIKYLKAKVQQLEHDKYQLEVELGKQPSAMSSHSLELKSDKYKGKDLYVGTMKGGKRDGPGYLEKKNGQVFIGQW